MLLSKRNEQEHEQCKQACPALQNQVNFGNFYPIFIRVGVEWNPCGRPRDSPVTPNYSDDYGESLQ